MKFEHSGTVKVIHEHHHYYHDGHNSEVGDKLDEVLTRLKAMKQYDQETRRQVMLDLSQLESEVARNTDVIESAKLVFTRLADEIEAAKNDPTKVQAVVDKLRAGTDGLATAVAAHTPAAPPTP